LVLEKDQWIEKPKAKDPYDVRMSIGPVQASMMLEKNTKNRKLNKNNVHKYVNDIAQGKWGNNNHGIAFYDDGTLADGQTRLHAVIQSGKTIRALVCFGLDLENSTTIDCGKTRNELAIAQIALEDPDGIALKAIGFYLETIALRNKTSQRQKIEFYESTRKHTSYILGRINHHKEGRKNPRGILCAYIISALIAARASGNVADQDLDNYIRVLVTGITSGKRDSIVVSYRDRLIANNNLSGHERREYYLRTQKSLKNYLDSNYKGYTKSNKALWHIPECLLPKYEAMTKIIVPNLNKA
jgi:hypothetical protein